MVRAILTVFRSAAPTNLRSVDQRHNNTAAWPGLALIPTVDSFCGGETLAHRSVNRTDAQLAVLAGECHW